MLKIVATTFLSLSCFLSLSIAHADTPLEISMKHIAKAYHQLVLDLKAPQDASKADYVALAATMKTEAQKARGLVPKKAAELPADQQAKMVASFQKGIDDLSAGIDVLSQDLQAGQWDAANKQIGTLKMQEDDGHKAFRKKEKEGGAPPPAPAPAESAPAAPADAAPSTNAPEPATPPPAAPMQ